MQPRPRAAPTGRLSVPQGEGQRPRLPDQGENARPAEIKHLMMLAESAAESCGAAAIAPRPPCRHTKTLVRRRAGS